MEKMRKMSIHLLLISVFFSTFLLCYRKKESTSVCVSLYLCVCMCVFVNIGKKKRKTENEQVMSSIIYIKNRGNTLDASKAV